MSVQAIDAADIFISPAGNGNAGYLVAVFGLDLVHESIIAQHLQAVVRRNFDAVLIDEYFVKGVGFWLSFEHDARVT
jgi:hypothetical protein